MNSNADATVHIVGAMRDVVQKRELLGNIRIDLNIGFFSTDHAGIVTHHDTYISLPTTRSKWGVPKD